MYSVLYTKTGFFAVYQRTASNHSGHNVQNVHMKLLARVLDEPFSQLIQLSGVALQARKSAQAAGGYKDMSSILAVQ